MKRSKLFLGITTGVLAAVAFTAAKSTNFIHKVKGYITSTSVPAKCTLPAAANQWYTMGAISSAYCKTWVSGVRTVFEYNKTGTCVHPLYTIPAPID